MPRYYLLFCAGIFAFMGMWALVSPQGMVSLIGLRAESTDAIADVRAMYGGLELAWAAVLVWHANKPERIAVGLYMAAAAIGALGLSRIVSMLLTELAAMSVFLCVSEIAAAAVAAWLARSGGQRATS